jgi:hypothetical protein
MPCCAFAVCIVAQLVFGVRALQRAVFGGAAGESTARNAVVEWRLDSAAAKSLDLAPPLPWLAGRRPLRAFALAAALEFVIAVGAIYGLAGHLGHLGGGVAHFGHDHRAEGVEHDRGDERVTTHGEVDAERAASPRGNIHAVHDGQK